MYFAYLPEETVSVLFLYKINTALTSELELSDDCNVLLEETSPKMAKSPVSAFVE